MNTLDIPQLHADPLSQFSRWYDDWAATGPADASAMVLSTVDAAGQPWSRTVLLKACDAQGFVFFTNRDSNKGQQLAQNARVALHFLWLPRAEQISAGTLPRQVLVQGRASQTSAAEDDAYFATRPRESQLGAWASQQSRPLAARAVLVDRFEAAVSQYGGADVPRPAHWGGFRVQPERVEFWQAGAHRLHDRFVYTRADSGWAISRLNP